MKSLYLLGVLAVIGGVLFLNSVTYSQESDSGKYEMGLRGGISLADGTPSNDMLVYGLYGTYRLDDSWKIGLSLDVAEGDFEQPAKFLGIIQDPAMKVIDTSFTNTIVSVWVQREFATESKFKPYLSAGIGIGSVVVDDVSGPV